MKEMKKYQIQKKKVNLNLNLNKFLNNNKIEKNIIDKKNEENLKLSYILKFNLIF